MPGTPHLQLIREAERRGELAAALFRLLIFATLLAALGVESALAGHVHPLTMTVLLYGVATIAGLLLALLGRVSPGVAYLFVTFDVATLVAVLVMISMMGRFPGRDLLALPLAGFVFVILIHAAIRYRPAMVGYGAVLFLTLVLAAEAAVQRVPGVFERLLAHPAAHDAIEMAPMAGAGRHAVSLALVGLAATLLIYLVWRTRQLLERAIAQEQRVTRLARFFAPAVARELAEAPPSTGLDGHRQPAAVMFIDIRGFTRLAETMPPHELGEMLCEFRGVVVGCIREGEGVVDKFIGDAVLAVFGTPRPRPDDAARALRTALEVLQRVGGWSAARVTAGSSSIAVGIGLHYGEVFAGVLGDEAMLEHTVIGDTVNVAERLERLTRVLPGHLVVSEAIEHAAGLPLDESRWQRVTGVQLEGRAGTIAVAVLRDLASGAGERADVGACLPAPMARDQPQ